VILIIIFTFSSIIIPLPKFSSKIDKFREMNNENTPQYSGETVYNKEWLNNNDFLTQDDWFFSKGAQGDNTTVDANISNGQANYIIIGENSSYEVLAGQANSSTWSGWGIYNNSDFLLPDVVEINSTGGYVYHYLDESENLGAGQVHNFPSVHFRKNVSLPEDISDYNIISASLEVIFNATVESSVDAPGDAVGQSAIWDSATFYIEIADLNLSYSFRVGENKTSNLGQDNPSVLNITDRELTYVSESDLITALNLALDKDPSHSEFTIILGIDIYCEDNDFPDYDEWSALIFKSFNLTFSYERKVDKFTSISWTQIGNQITGSNVQVTDANLKFKYKIDQNWSTALSPYSEIRIWINNNLHPETIRLSTAITSFQDAKVDGFDLTNLILKNINITLSVQVFIANTFELGKNVTISLDDIFLNITYVETYSDIETQTNLFLNTENKTADPLIELPIAYSLNITIKYIENQTLNHITGAIVQLEGKTSGILNENSSLGQYSVIINTTQLGIGLWFLNIRAQKNNYLTKLIPFYVNVIERPTEFKLFVNSEDKTTNNTAKIKSNQFMNITVLYQDNSSKEHLNGANVSLSGIGNFTELNNQFNFTLNSNTLGLGFFVLTIIAQLQNYTTQTFQLFVEVFKIATELKLLINGTQRFESNIIQVEVFEYINLTAFYLNNNSKTHLGGATITLLSIGNFSEIGNQYNYSLNSANLNLGFNVITIYAQLDNYETQTIQFFIEVFEKESTIRLLVNSIQRNESDVIQVEVNQVLNFTLIYKDNLTKLNLPGVSVELIDWGNFSEINNQYNLTLNSNTLGLGFFVLTFIAQLQNYTTQTFQLFVEVFKIATELKLLVNGTQRFESDIIQVEVFEYINLTAFYLNNNSKTHLGGAIITLLSIGNFSEIGNQYNYSLNSVNLNLGFNVITIYVQLDNYETQTIQFFIEVFEKESTIQLLVNSIQRNESDIIQVKVNQVLNFTLFYKDNRTKLNLPGVSVELIDWGNFSENNNQYNLTLNSNTLGLGFFVLAFIAQLQNYTTQTFQLFVEVFKIATELKLLVNGTQRFESDIIQMEVFEYINLTAFYLNDTSKNHLSGATITLLSIGNFSEIGNQYNYSLNSANLNLGFNVITIYAQLDNYETQTIQFFIEVFEKESTIRLLVNSIQRNESDIVQVEVNQFLNITLFYKDNLTKLNLPGVSVELIDWGNFSEFTSQYNYTIDTNDLEQGITLLTIQAQLTNYKSQIIQFYVKVIEKETELLLYVNNVKINTSYIMQIEVNQLLNVTLFYLDNLTKLSIPGAIVKLIGWGNFSEIINQYNYTIDTNDLELGITILIVQAQMTNYKPQTIRFHIEVFERSSKMQLSLNSEDNTVIELPIGSNLNIIVKFTDNVTGFHIYNAFVNLGINSVLHNFTEDLVLKQYSFNINTTILNIGVNLIKVTAYKENYAIQDINLRITINKISVEISTESGESHMITKPGQNVNLRIILNDTDFGGNIKGAIITYTWAYGQGNLTDTDNDGVYEAVLENVPVGVYSIAISASGVDNYNFGNYKITLSVNQPIRQNGQTWLVYLLIAGIVGASGGFASYQLHFKYPPLVRKIRKLRKRIKKGRKSKPIIISKREEIINNTIINQTKILDLEAKKIENKTSSKIEKI